MSYPCPLRSSFMGDSLPGPVLVSSVSQRVSDASIPGHMFSSPPLSSAALSYASVPQLVSIINRNSDSHHPGYSEKFYPQTTQSIYYYVGGQGHPRRFLVPELRLKMIAPSYQVTLDSTAGASPSIFDIREYFQFLELKRKVPFQFKKL